MTERKNNARNVQYQIGKTVGKKNHNVLETRRERENKVN
jgi:hypothetical protein